MGAEDPKLTNQINEPAIKHPKLNDHNFLFISTTNDPYFLLFYEFSLFTLFISHVWFLIKPNKKQTCLYLF